MATKTPLVLGADGRPGQLQSPDTLPASSLPAGLAVRASTNDFRLTLTSGTPVTTADVTAAGTLYLSPHTGRQIATYDSSAWTLRSSAEVSLALTLTSGKNYDVFAYWTGSALALELSAAWTNDTTRADALAQQDGVWVKSADHSRRYVGTIRASGTNTTEDSMKNRLVWNAANQVQRQLFVTEGATSWTYNSTTLRPLNNSTANRVAVVAGQLGGTVRLTASLVLANPVSGGGPQVSIGEDSTTATASGCLSQDGPYGSGVAGCTAAAFLEKVPSSVGYHYYQCLEAISGSGTVTFWGVGLTGMLGGCWA